MPASTSAIAVCLYVAAQFYQVPPGVLMAIMHVEGGRVGQEVRPNVNGPTTLARCRLIPCGCRSWRKHGILIDTARVANFFSSAKLLLQNSSNLDRGSRNIGSLLFAGLPVAEGIDVSFSCVDVDDAVVRGKAEKSQLKQISINQLDLRNADVSDIFFKEVAIATLIPDETTRVSVSFPNVGWIQLVTESMQQKTLAGETVAKWLDDHGRSSLDADNALVPADVRGHGLFQLLEKVCRIMLRQPLDS